jgi:hypothetical protein
MNPYNFTLFLLMSFTLGKEQSAIQKGTEGSLLKGTWFYQDHWIRLRPISSSYYKIEFEGYYTVNADIGDIRTGFACGIGYANDDVIMFPFDNAIMVLKVIGETLEVNQAPNTGIFGLGVSSEGIYKKISNQEPDFNEYLWSQNGAPSYNHRGIA